MVKCKWGRLFKHFCTFEQKCSYGNYSSIQKQYVDFTFANADDITVARWQMWSMNGEHEGHLCMQLNVHAFVKTALSSFLRNYNPIYPKRDADALRNKARRGFSKHATSTPHLPASLKRCINLNGERLYDCPFNLACFSAESEIRRNRSTLSQAPLANVK